MTASVESQKLGYARRLLKNELNREGYGAAFYEAGIDGCRKALAYCENYKHYHPGIVSVMADLEARRKLLIQSRDEMSDFKQQEYEKRMEHKEWLRQSRI